MRKTCTLVALLVSATLAHANEIPPGAQSPLIEIAGLGWTMSARAGAASGGATPATFSVYSGCTQPPNAPGSYTSSKAWYFNSATGAAPGSGGLGTQVAPFDDPRAIFAQNGNFNWTGWSKPLAVYSGYQQTGGIKYPDFSASGTVTITPTGSVTVTAAALWSRVSDGMQFTSLGQAATSSPFTLVLHAQQPGVIGNTISGSDSFVPISGVTGTVASATGPITGGVDYDDPVNGDTTHSRLWPGDTVYLNGSWPNNLVALHPTVGPAYSLDDAGSTKWTWITTDPAASQNAFVNGFLGSDMQGIIVQNVTAGHPAAPAATNKAAIQVTLGSAYMSVPTTSMKLYLAQQEWDYVNSHTGAHQIVIGGSNLDAINNTYQELLADATMSGLMTFAVNGGAFKFSWSGGSPAAGSADLSSVVTASGFNATSHTTNVPVGTTFTVGTDTWTFVSGTPGTHQVQIGTSLNGGVGSTFANLQTALPAAYPGMTLTITQPTGIQATAIATGPAGAYQYRIVGAGGVSAGVVKSIATLPLLFTQNDAQFDHIVSISGTKFQPTKDVVLSGLNVSSANYGNAYPGPTTSDMPQTGSQGVDVLTGLHASAGQGGLSWYTASTPLPASIPNGAPYSANPTDGTTFSADGITYTWKNTPVTPCPNGGAACDIKIGANLIASLVTAAADVNANDSAIVMQEYANGGPWNQYDFSTLEAGAITITGNVYPDASTSANVVGASCVSLGNSYAHHAQSVNIANLTNSIEYNMQTAYSTGDNYDIGTSNSVVMRALKANNSLYDESALHSDGIQTQSGILFSVASQSFAKASNNITIENSDMITPTDSVITSQPFQTLDAFGLVETLANLEMSGIQMSWWLNNSIIRNNVFLVPTTGIQAADVFNTVFANNDFLRPGVPATVDGGSIVGVGIKAEFATGQTWPSGNVYVNNLTNGVGLGIDDGSHLHSTANYCSSPDPSTLANNLSIPPVEDGVLQGSIQDMGFWCKPGTTIPAASDAAMNSGANANGCGSQGGQAVIVSPPATECGITVGAFTGAGGIMQAYAPVWTANNGILDQTQLNPKPPGYPSSPTGGLVCAGTMVTGVSTTNHDGLPWAGGANCVGVGAY